MPGLIMFLIGFGAMNSPYIETLISIKWENERGDVEESLLLVCLEYLPAGVIRAYQPNFNITLFGNDEAALGQQMEESVIQALTNYNII